ncbi:MAG: ribulose-phosphate 3-epimerase, partial [Chloroflexota bacterium]
MRILPAILTTEASDLEAKLRQAETFTDWVQIDIMDGVFVPSHSITAAQLAAVPTRLKLEVHLMVREPQLHLADYQKAGASRVVIHYEATRSLNEAVSQARDLGLSPGLALNPETPASVLAGFKDSIDFILLLSVHPGYYGREFIPEVLDKVAQ